MSQLMMAVKTKQNADCALRKHQEKKLHHLLLIQETWPVWRRCCELHAHYGNCVSGAIESTTLLLALSTKTHSLHWHIAWGSRCTHFYWSHLPILLYMLWPSSCSLLQILFNYHNILNIKIIKWSSFLATRSSIQHNQS